MRLGRPYGASGTPHVDRVIPDGCMDLLFVDGRLMFAGPDTQAVELEPRIGARIAGVRFRPA
ncbi:MAG TPA: DUF6597 domain-containing transcriptional factor [Polyangia bacterium]|nr:DUF6597 domain-containing transcriptional factor [Polyangia bacterium]